MCGFVGISLRSPDQCVDSDILLRMNNTLAHRGPDDQGMFIHGHVGLAHRRLSIIDLSHGAAQPLFNETRTVAVVFNGEIYNHAALRRELSALGHTFATKSDTEILVHGWEAWGEGLPAKLDGMFAFALYDTAAMRLFLARDRFGKKPLYYALVNGNLVFGSELKAFFPFPGFAPEIDPLSVRQYFAHDYVPTPRTIYRDCWKMPAASCACIPTDEPPRLPVPQAYWQLNYQPKLRISLPDAVEEGNRLLQRAVEKRLMSDVALGVLLSGGIDSSSVVAEMRRVVPSAEIETFSVGFTEDSYDETPFARCVANHFHTHHHERRVTEADVMAHLEPILSRMDEPFADTSLLPTSLLCRFAREQVTVALGGDGGDELLAGYDPFLVHHLLGPAGKLFEGLRPMLSLAEKWLPASDRNMSLRFRLHHLLQGFPPGFGGEGAMRTAFWMSPFPPAQLAGLFEDPDGCGWPSAYDASIRLMERSCKEHSIDAMADWFLRMYMHDDILVKSDRASMLHSLEVRSPFLDTDFAEFACRLPVKMKLRGRTRKWLLREMMRDRLPRQILARGKKGFGMPIAGWLRGKLSVKLRELSETSLLRRQGIFSPPVIQAMIREHAAGSGDHRKPLWAFLSYQIWAEQHGFLT